MAINLLDITANNNDLTNSNATEVTTGLPFAASSIAVDLESTTPAYLYAGDSASLSITGDMTIELWVKFESLAPTDDQMMMINKMGASGNRSFFFDMQNVSTVSKMHFRCTAGGTDLTSANVNWAPSTGTWYHVAVAYTAAGGTADFYVDGVQQGTQQSGLPTSLYDSTASLEIGAFGATTWPFDGVIDEVRIWNDVRTVTEISDNMSVELTGSEANLVAYWPFEVLAGADLVPNVSDSITITDTPVTNLAVQANISESITITDTPTLLIIELTPNISDSITVSESVVMDQEIVIGILDSITVTDTLTAYFPFLAPDIPESITITDTPIMDLELKANVSDSITITESVANDLEIKPNVSDSITISESVVMNQEILASVSESITVTEAITMNLILMPQLSDSITVTDTDSVRRVRFAPITNWTPQATNSTDWTEVFK